MIDDLTSLGDAVVPAMIGVLRGGTNVAREAAGRALEKLGPNAINAASYLAAALGDEDKDVRFRAIKALQSIGEDAEPWLWRERDAESPVSRHNAGYASSGSLRRARRTVSVGPFRNVPDL